MYYDYFGLKQPPFRITPDTRLFFPGGNRGAVLEALVYAIVSGEGIVKVVGEVGSGKTMLCRMLEKELPANVEVVYLANPSLSPENILHAIAFELKLPVQADEPRLKVMNCLQNYLLERHAEDRQVVVFIEEAQSMPIATLEEIRLLSNLETAQDKLLQIVLFGQPELDEMIAKKEIRQLKERITYSFQLSPFKKEDIRDYINARLRACGYRASDVFNPSAISAMQRFSDGLLRRVNILADKAMLAAYANNQNQVSARHVKVAAKDSEFVTNPGRFVVFAGVTLAVCVLLVGVLFYFQQAAISRANSSPTITDQVTGGVGNNIEPEAAEVNSPAGSSEPHYDPFASSRGTVYVNHDVPIQSGPDTDESYIPDNNLEVPAWKNIHNEVVFYPGGRGQKTAKLTENKGKILDLSQIIEAMGSVKAGFYNEKIALLQQLELLPPESIINTGNSAAKDTCKLCTSIIYRPLSKEENL